ncbi:MAG: leucine-rich repeat protein [Clostridiales bacterium]|nr:leucine-rich repeat protein [Clostridiales bacterium]
MYSDGRRISGGRIAPLCLAILLCLLTGCGNAAPQTAFDCCQIVIESGEHYGVFGAVQSVPRGSDVSFTIQLTDHNLVESVDYPDYTLTDGAVSSIDGTNYQILTLHQVKYSTVVSLTTYQPYTIRYLANGGVRMDVGEGDEVEISASLSHLRLNTALGQELFERPGYVLTGWNTCPDGSGTAVSLGSRIDRELADCLYAQWSPWTEAESFQYTVSQGEATITGYSGTEDTLTIPAELGGFPVREIGALACADAVCTTLVLPESVETIAPDAFRNAKIESVFLYDSLVEVSDESFSGCGELKTIHINAACAPRYSGTYYDTFPDKMDWLRSLEGERKIVLVAGSSVRFGFDSALLDEAFPDYAVANMGVYAYSNQRPQYDLILQWMQEGDILLSTPEFDAVETQFCVSDSVGWEFFCMVEGDYDLMSLLDCRTYTGVWDDFCTFLAVRRDLPEKSYEVSAQNYDEENHLLTDRESYNQYGDYICPRPNQTEDKAFGIKLANYDPAAYSDETIQALNRVYRRFQDKGVTVYFSYAPRSLRAITEESTPENRAALDRLLRDELCVPVISDIEESMYTGYYFYATDNHLSDEGVEIRTDRIISDLRRQMSAETG